MHRDEAKSALVKAVTNEGTLFVYRLVTGLAAIYLIGKATQIANFAEEMKKEVQEIRLSYTKELGATAAKVEVLNSRVDAHARRHDGTDNDVRDINRRLNDMYFKRNP